MIYSPKDLYRFLRSHSLNDLDPADKIPVEVLTYNKFKRLYITKFEYDIRNDLDSYSISIITEVAQ